VVHEVVEVVTHGVHKLLKCSSVNSCAASSLLHTAGQNEERQGVQRMVAKCLLDTIQSLTLYCGIAIALPAVTLPGYGYSAGPPISATQCAAGTFNAGGNQLACQSCPTGLTTSSAGATSSTACSSEYSNL
jgi:hypothetical protein